MNDSYLDDKRVANVVIAKNFNHTSEDVQLHALEVCQRSHVN